MVLMIFFFFLVAWVFSLKYGLVSTLIRRSNQRRNFDNQVVLGHIHHHEGQPDESAELAASTLHQHFRWSPGKMRRTLNRLRTRNLVHVEANQVSLTPRGENRVQTFRQTQLANESAGE
jgi:manganese/zinc/iron transport system permease protein